MNASLCLDIKNGYDIIYNSRKVSPETRLKSHWARTTLNYTINLVTMTAYIQRITHEKSSYLEYCCTAAISDIPVSNFTITITRANKVILLWMEVQRHNRSRMSRKST